MPRWTLSAVEEVKARTRVELSALAPATKLEQILARIAALEADASTEGAIQRYVLVVSALVHHARDGGLSDLVMRRLLELARAILATSGVKPESRTLGRLFGDLHLVHGQILWRAGRLWDAAWQQKVGEIQAGRDGASPAEIWIGAANRPLRLGYASRAIEDFRRALASPLPVARAGIAQAGLAKALRLAGRFDEARIFSAELAKQAEIAPATRLELSWEAACASATESGDLGPLVTATARNGSHYEGDYVVEAMLWAHASTKTHWSERFPAVRTIQRNPRLRDVDAELLRVASVLERCDDAAVPLRLRIEGLGDLLSEAAAVVPGIENHLLLLAAAASWLTRSKAVELADLVASEYRAKSFTLTDGRSGDTLGLFPEAEAERCSA